MNPTMDLRFSLQKLCRILLVLISLATNIDTTNRSVFNVTNFGAVADGKTDDLIKVINFNLQDSEEHNFFPF